MQLRETTFIGMLAVALSLAASGPLAQSDRLQPGDLLKLRSVGAVRSSPDSARLAYTVMSNDRPGRSYSQVWIMDLSSGTTSRIDCDAGSASMPQWSPDGKTIAYPGTKRGLTDLETTMEDEHVWLIDRDDKAEQFYIALKDVGVQTVMVRYPREGHGLREAAHVVDMIERSIAWHEKHFPPVPPASTSAGRP